MVKLFQVLAAILTGVAVFFLWQGNYDGVFVSAALSSASYFLSFRYKVKERLDIRDAEQLERELDEEYLNQKSLPENKSLFDIEETDFERGKEKVLNEK